MPILRIEHQVPDFAGWKQAFDSDPAGRERSGVRRYAILRAVDDPNYVLIDLEFDLKKRLYGGRSRCYRAGAQVRMRQEAKRGLATCR